MSINKPKICVIGSLNMDLVTETNRVPEEGETVIGESFMQFSGGKGANQAVAASRLGGDVRFVGCVGKDTYGDELIRQLEAESINLDGVYRTGEASTGIAQITVSNKENSIIVIPGANYILSEEWVEKNVECIVSADIILVQLEIPLEVIARVVDIAYKNSVPVILNPAPAQELPENSLKKVSYITPNESELAILTSVNGDIASEIKELQSKGVNHVVVTRGSKEVAYKGTDSWISFKETLKVDAIDSTGAGDAFNGALAFAVGSGLNLNEAIDFSIKVAAHSVTKIGAQSGMPFFTELT